MNWNQNPGTPLTEEEIKNAPELPGIPPPPPRIEMDSFTHYEEDTGRIKQNVYTMVASNAPAGLKSMAGTFSPDKQYVDLADNLAVKDKTPNPATMTGVVAANMVQEEENGRDTIRVSLPLISTQQEGANTTSTISIENIAPKTKVYAGGVDIMVVDDGQLTISASTVGEYRIELDSVQHLRKVFTIEVTE